MPRSSSTLASAAGVAVVVIALAVIHGICAGSLLRTSFLTGWGLLLVVGVQADRRWRKVRRADASAEWLSGQGGLVLIAVMLFGMHLDFRIPDGWLDCVLAGMFALLLASAAVAALLLRTRPGHQAARHWLLFHTSLIASVITLGAMHGVLAHTHSVLAYVVLGR